MGEASEIPRISSSENDQVSLNGCLKKESPDGDSALMCGCSLRTQQGALKASANYGNTPADR
ncbi:hypothetical protein, partial [Actinoplanes cyaneus]